MNCRQSQEDVEDTSFSLAHTETDLSNTQGFIKAITKLVRSIGRTNHLTELLTTSLGKKKQP